MENWIVLIIVLLVISIPLYLLINFFICFIKREFYDYKKLTDKQKLIYKFIIGVFVIPVIIYLFDRYNWFSTFKFTENLTKNYDWLSFIGIYAGTIISAMFLLFITKLDREDNTESIRSSQRPYLVIDCLTLSKTEIEKYDAQDIYKYEDDLKEEILVPVLKVTNAGETVAIINVDEAWVNINYSTINNIENGINKTNNKNKKISIKKFIKRMAIPSGKTVYICFNDDEFDIEMLMEYIIITECNIEYKDLFNYKYVDKSIYGGKKINVEIDNSMKEKK